MHADLDPSVIVALDFARARDAYDLVQRLEPKLCRLKVGQELFTAAGPQFVERLVAHGFGVFLDLKFHDIPNTVHGACRAAGALGAWMVNVHAAGGRAMLAAAREAIPAGPAAPKLTAVTLLTSMGDDDLEDIGMHGTPEEAVLRLARLAHACGLDGVVCSAREAPLVREACGGSFCLVTPGIRPTENARDDQQRVATPARAIEWGASYLVIGRPVTRATDPLAALERINQEISAARRSGS